MVMVRIFWFLLVCVSFVVSCSKPKLTSLVKDDSFDYRKLRMGHLLVTLPSPTDEARSTAFSKLRDSEKRALAAHTIQVIQKNNENINVKPIYAHKKYKKGLRNIIESLSQEEMSNIDKLASTFMSFPDPYRYLFIVKPMNEKTWQDERVYTRNNPKEVLNNKGQKVKIKETFRHKDLISFRKVDINGLVIDLKFKAIVWDGLASKTLSNVNSMKKKVGSRATVADIVFRNDKHPAYPELVAATKAAIYDLALNLPSEDDD